MVQSSPRFLKSVAAKCTSLPGAGSNSQWTHAHIQDIDVIVILPIGTSRGVNQKPALADQPLHFEVVSQALPTRSGALVMGLAAIYRDTLPRER